VIYLVVRRIKHIVVVLMLKTMLEMLSLRTCRSGN